MTGSRRDLLRFAGAGLAAGAVLSPRNVLWAQVQEEAENGPVTLIRKGILVKPKRNELKTGTLLLRHPMAPNQSQGRID